MNRYFTNVTSMQAKAIREKISMTVCLTKYEDEIYSYDFISFAVKLLSHTGHVKDFS